MPTLKSEIVNGRIGFVSTIEDRKKLWKMHHAVADLETVTATCNYVIAREQELPDFAYYSLVASIYTLYGRPFTRSNGAGKLSEEIVPADKLALHKQLIEQRHQIYAHSDAVGPDCYIGCVNQVRYFVKDGCMQPGVARLHARAILLKEVPPLCAALIEKANYWIDKLQARYFKSPVPDGEYVINLDEKSSAFITKSPPMPSPASFLSKSIFAEGTDSTATPRL